MSVLLCDTAESRRQTIQETLDSEKSGAERNKLGQFATPNTLAVEIAEFVNSLIPARSLDIFFADPSIGSGSFFSAAMTVFKKERMSCALGIEIDPLFCRAARGLWSEAGLDVIEGDFTKIVAHSSRPKSPNVILANPPYVRHHHMERDEKLRLQHLTQRLTGVDVSGLAGLYVYFLLLATAWMQDNGIAAWLIPSEFMDVNYGSALKRFLVNQVELVRIHRFDPANIQFDDALVTSVVVVFRKTKPTNEHTVEFTFGGTMSLPHISERVSSRLLQESRKWTIYPEHIGNDRHASIDIGAPTLSDLFRIQRGIATGNNKFFIINRAEAIRRNLPDEYLRPILPSPRHLKTTIIQADKDGYPDNTEQLCLIDCDLPEQVVENRFPALWNYLKTADELGIKDGYLVGKRVPWYKQEQRGPALFLCTYMGRGSGEKQPFRFIWNRSRAVGTNLYLMLYPKIKLTALLVKHPEFGVEIHELLRRVTGNELRGEGRVYGGGLNKIEPSELGRVSASPFVERWPELHCDRVVQTNLFT